MKLNSLSIENFRNFSNISVDLTNQNVIFGMNDMGKTNFMYALRFLLDKDIRSVVKNTTNTRYGRIIEIPD
ncbi:DNA replication and repair protein RecF [Paenibacillus solanacearum]|uniref:DNA replication and repair protein RecF n=1 Tax=Paenibacillus solanacearum TaxID=2048548 RepID=A0A916K511_9BACL|nr:AAA family ATPase [Paenibacillus solanacearum]CAG7644930.1 DNA replication and repair protein RecF [Paenibacillus solanacearum]